MMPLKDIFKNKLLIAKHYPGFSESDMNIWPFWQFEENIKLINEMHEEESKDSKKQQEGQNEQMGNMNPSSYMKNMNKFQNKMKPPKF